MSKSPVFLIYHILYLKFVPFSLIFNNVEVNIHKRTFFYKELAHNNCLTKLPFFIFVLLASKSTLFFFSKVIHSFKQFLLNIGQHHNYLEKNNKVKFPRSSTGNPDFVTLEMMSGTLYSSLSREIIDHLYIFTAFIILWLSFKNLSFLNTL